MTVHINQPHGSVMPIKFSPCATNPCVATPNRRHVPTKPCTTTNRAARPSESCKKNIRAEPHEPPRPAPVQAVVTNRRAVHPSRASRTAGPCICPSTRQCTRPCIRPTRALGRAHARAHARAHPPDTRTRSWHSAVHTLDTRTRPCIRPSTPTVLPKSPWTFCAPHSHI